MCQWQKVHGQLLDQSGIHYRCIDCGFVTQRTWHPEQLVMECNSPCTGRNVVHDLPSYFKRVIHFYEDYKHHIASGSQLSSNELILERFSQYCSSCEFYNDLAGLCMDCGCYVNLYPANENLNKLAWADSECPKGYWKARLPDKNN